MDTISILIIVIIILVVIFVLAYYFRPKPKNADEELENSIQQELNNLPEDLELPETKCLAKGDQVFNVGNNLFTYDEAKNVCKSFDGELASLKQVMDSYKDGADWCNYGWIKGQMAVFPTQQATFDEKQRSPYSERLECGLPGVNGGYFENGKFLFGATCYGKKPSKKAGHEDDNLINKLVSANNHKAYEKLKNVEDLDILPFNKERWSQ